MWFHHLLVKYVNDSDSLRSPTDFFLCIIINHAQHNWKSFSNFHIFDLKHKRSEKYKKNKVARAREWCHRWDLLQWLPKSHLECVLQKRLWKSRETLRRLWEWENWVNSLAAAEVRSGLRVSCLRVNCPLSFWARNIYVAARTMDKSAA